MMVGVCLSVCLSCALRSKSKSIAVSCLCECVYAYALNSHSVPLHSPYRLLDSTQVGDIRIFLKISLFRVECNKSVMFGWVQVWAVLMR